MGRRRRVQSPAAAVSGRGWRPFDVEPPQDDDDVRDMPTVLRIGPYRLFFYASDRPEPAHVHVERDDRRAKFWLAPVRLGDSGGFRGPELARVTEIVTRYEADLRRAWNAYFLD